ncbi:hypothetical protein F2Q68_00037515 [Brassica cretica]|uniref:Uncharacterized protein n=1 Tax=Brassica cretica TaxID=69181 RepID=A0A8S9H526_BRACR|nr:hypothetical protein F2Q68_00037515 [Brassica cretica]
MGCCLSAGKVTAPPVPTRSLRLRSSAPSSRTLSANSTDILLLLLLLLSLAATCLEESPDLREDNKRRYNQPNPTHNRRNVDSSPLPRSGLLEGPRRRSRSTATRGPSSARRSPMKKREAALEKEGAEVKVKKEVAVEEKKEEEDVAVTEPDVSMECFIFL